MPCVLHFVEDGWLTIRDFRQVRDANAGRFPGVVMLVWQSDSLTTLTQLRERAA